jgi:hypothetical protein
MNCSEQVGSLEALSARVMPYVAPPNGASVDVCQAYVLLRVEVGVVQDLPDFVDRRYLGFPVVDF